MNECVRIRSSRRWSVGYSISNKYIQFELGKLSSSESFDAGFRSSKTLGTRGVEWPLERVVRLPRGIYRISYPLRTLGPGPSVEQPTISLVRVDFRPNEMPAEAIKP